MNRPIDSIPNQNAHGTRPSRPSSCRQAHLVASTEGGFLSTGGCFLCKGAPGPSLITCCGLVFMMVKKLFNRPTNLWLGSFGIPQEADQLFKSVARILTEGALVPKNGRTRCH